MIVFTKVDLVDEEELMIVVDLMRDGIGRTDVGVFFSNRRRGGHHSQVCVAQVVGER